MASALGGQSRGPTNNTSGAPVMRSTGDSDAASTAIGTGTTGTSGAHDAIAAASTWLTAKISEHAG